MDWATYLTRPDILIGGLTFLSVIAVGVSILLARKRRSRMLESRLKENAWAHTDHKHAEKRSRLPGLFEKIGNFASHGQVSTTLWEQLVQAGHFSAGAPAIYTGIKMLLFAGGLGTAAVLVMPMDVPFATKIAIISLGGAVPFFLPNLVLMLQRKARHREICLYLPQAVDLLEICVSSGIGLNMAWNMVANEIQQVSSVLSNEMALTNFEIHLGADRAEAMRRMARRTGAEELSSLAAILIQTDRFGTSVAAALREFAASLREERDFRAEENAEKMAVKLVIPMVLFIFPAVLIIIVGPAIVTIFKSMISAS
jgi:tight adherence protein C